MRSGLIVLSCSSLLTFVSACCEETTCERGPVVERIKVLFGGEIVDCGQSGPRSEEEIRRCIDDAQAHERGYLYSLTGEWETIFVETKDEAHFEVRMPPGRGDAQRLSCSQLIMLGSLPMCDRNTWVREESICSGNTCGTQLG